MTNAFQEVWRNPWVRVAVFLFFIYLIFQFLQSIISVILVFLAAYLIAYLFNPMLDWMQRRRVRRGVGILLVLLLLVAFIALGILILIAVVNQLTSFAQQLPQLIDSGGEFFRGLLKRFNDFEKVPLISQYSEQLGEIWQRNVSSLSQNALNFFRNLLQQSGTFIGSFANSLLQGLFIVILSIYLMSDYHRINQTLLKVFPERWQPKVLELSGQVNTAIGGYLRGQIAIATIVGSIVGIGLAIVGVPSALALGFVAGLFNIIPYLGVIIAIVPTILLALSVGWLKAVLAVVVFIIANQLEGHVFSPMILGRTTNLHPATVLLSILVGVTVMGIWGALLAVPLVALGKLLLQNYYYPSRFYRSTEVRIIRPDDSKISS
ncbi:AI-2E family transporter [Deinococcus cellulosilyticus]|uniref:AI-2E family transporter n=1 Tax=Deinococcus cellulosilyticus (strain DSM 18568 / NBRC 106333 / KACC 11606 / 5516J-15) TaxID=1223518 RepID=A0A511N2J0_DEIC1|nr:AI-2E family transporter [Deinococcus cellulosilyticus]GEM47070.1 AI-2E family transporter [Deinococcus cellulosilyticus NBRC 106333 = KACC 11606]